MFAIIGFSLYLHTQTGLDGAAREGARRYAIMQAHESISEEEIETAIANYMYTYGITLPHVGTIDQTGDWRQIDNLPALYRTEFDDDRVYVYVRYPRIGIFSPPPTLPGGTGSMENIDWLHGSASYAREGVYDERRDP